MNKTEPRGIKVTEEQRKSLTEQEINVAKLSSWLTNSQPRTKHAISLSFFLLSFFLSFHPFLLPLFLLVFLSSWKSKCKSTTVRQSLQQVTCHRDQCGRLSHKGPVSGCGVTVKQCGRTVHEKSGAHRVMATSLTLGIEAVTHAMQWLASQHDTQITHAIILTDSTILVESGMGCPDRHTALLSWAGQTSVDLPHWAYRSQWEWAGG